MFSTSTVLDKDVQKALIKNVLTFWIVLVVVNSLIIVVTLFIFDFYTLILGIVLLVTSIVSLITLNKMIKNCKGNIVNNYQFFESYFTVESIKDNEKMGESKVYYKDLIKKKITEEYIFLYINKASAFPIKLKNLQDYEIKILKNWLNLN